MLTAVRERLRLLSAYLATNLQIQLEYRASFVSLVLGMFINDGLWLAFWALYFTRFPVVNGWGRQDVMMLWAVMTLGFGIAIGLFGNATSLAEIITQGQLDYYLVLPKRVLSHVLVARINVPMLGDILFGAAVFTFLTGPTWTKALIFLVVSLCSAAIFLAYTILTQSLSFYMGNAEMLSSQLGMALVSFATYPPGIFSGTAKVFLYTVVPAAFVGAIPVTLIRQFTWPLLGLLAGVAAAALIGARWFFYRGLRRYESGNLLVMRA
ncbi:MAG: ABC transporter permease [Symbiobacteriia bacterium]